MIRSAIAGILALLAAATASAQQFPTIPGQSVIGRIGLPGDSGPSQAIPLAKLNTALGLSQSIVAAGAKCDGTTDDAGVIQRVINSLAATGGGTVLIPNKTCVIASSLLISSNGIILRGQGRDASTLFYTGSQTGIIYNNSIENVGIIDLTVSSASTTNTLIKMSAINTGFTLERVLLKGGGIQMLVTSTDASNGGSYSVRCINSDFQGASLAGFKSAPLGNGLAAANNIIGCDFSGFKQYAIFATNGSALYVDHSHIERHLGAGATTSAVHVDTSTNASFSHMWFEDDSNNYIFDIGNNVSNFAIRDSLFQLNVANGTHTSAGALNVSGTGCGLISIENVRASVGGTIGSVWNTAACPVYGRSNGFDSGTVGTWNGVSGLQAWGFASTATSAQVDIDGTIQGATPTTFNNVGNLIQQVGVGRMALDGSNATATAAALRIGTTVVNNGTSSRVIYDNAGVLGEYTVAQLNALTYAALSGAVKANGAGVLSQAACADLSNGGTACTAATGTSGAAVPFLNGTNAWSGAQTFNDGFFKLAGATSGTLTQKAAATAGSNTITWPAGTTDFSATGGTSQYVKQATAGGALTVGVIPLADLPAGTGSYALATICASGCTSATNYTTASDSSATTVYRIRLVAPGGGAGGGGASFSSGGGGGAGAVCEFVGSGVAASTTLTPTLGATGAGGAAGANGTSGTSTSLVFNATTITAGPGLFGALGGAGGPVGAGGAGGTCTNATISIPGGDGETAGYNSAAGMFQGARGGVATGWGIGGNPGANTGGGSINGSAGKGYGAGGGAGVQGAGTGGNGAPTIVAIERMTK